MAAYTALACRFTNLDLLEFYELGYCAIMLCALKIFCNVCNVRFEFLGGSFMKINANINLLMKV